MKMTSNVHTHSAWCDGNNTLREMADAAIAIGFTDLGFSSHSPTPFDLSYPNMTDEAGYVREIAELKEEYAGRLGILCGIEQDCFGPINHDNYDYVIGAVHYLPLDGGYVSIDSSLRQTGAAAKVYDGGQNMYRKYYSLVYESAKRFSPDIIGHFDVIAKYNKGNIYFDETSADYTAAALEALDGVLDIIIPYGGMVELNTSAFVRGLRDVPYPDPFILKRIAQRGGRVIITTDSHRTSTLNAGFDTALEFLISSGFKSMAVLRDKKFIDVNI